MNRTITLLSLTILLCSFFGLSAQSVDEDIEKRMWNLDDPGFKETTIPDKWKNEPAVILGKSIDFEYKKQILSANVNNDYYFRQRIMLLDESAVKEFTEFSFDDLGRQSFSRDGIYLGIKVIKPDGTEKKINVEDAVQQLKFKNSKEKKTVGDGYNKLAIPGLEVGDIIDYYYVTINTASTKYTGKTGRIEFDPVVMVLTGEYPVLHGKIGFLPERRCYINLTVSNGAPGPQRRTIDGNDYFEISYSDLDKRRNELWTFALRQEPTVRFQAVIATAPSYSASERYYLGEQGIPKSEPTMEEHRRLLRICLSTNDLKGRLEAAGKKYIKKQRISDDPETFVPDLYYFFRNHLYFNFTTLYGYSYLNSRLFDRIDFISAFSYILRYYKIDHTVFIGVKRSVGEIDSTVILNEITPGIKVKSGGKNLYIYQPGGHSLPEEGDYLMEGVKYYGIEVVNGKFDYKTIITDYIPVSEPAVNFEWDTISVSFETIDPARLNIRHKVGSLGATKEQFKYEVLNGTDYFADELAHMPGIRKFKSSEVDDMERTLNEISRDAEESAKVRDEWLKGWLADFHKVNDVQASNLEIIQTGRFGEKPQLIFACDAATGELVKNAGNYLILEAGKIMGNNLDLSDNEKERDRDIFMPCPREYKWLVSIDIPEGYTVDKVDNFNLSIENETGGLTSKAEIIGRQVHIRVHKYYNHNYEPLENWPKMLEFLEAANDIVQQKLVFKKAG
ncbi:MAG: hypothetical protein KDC05_15815 [Bacteroidales bacterium]|nr:hypothetical protein [Bacteroidales bacterium]